MTKLQPRLRTALMGWGSVFLWLFVAGAGAGVCRADEAVTREQWLELLRKNEQLQQQLEQQRGMIDALTRKVSEIQTNTNQVQVADTLKPGAMESPEPTPSAGQGLRFGKLNIGGEGAVAFFDSQSGGENPHPTFRIDEARLFFDAQVWQNVYFYSEIDLTLHENPTLNLEVGELYLDFEDVSELWGGRGGLLNVRVGRFYTPFGEEYLNRFAINNPLISHSVSDVWGADDGLELYGSVKQVQYAVAVQNGGNAASTTLQSDKSVAGRIAYDPNRWLHLSLSGMRTGNLKAENHLTALWFGGGFFRPLGSPVATTFHANLVEGDIQFRLPSLQLKSALGYIDYGDNDPTGVNHRDLYYYYVEGVYDLTRGFYSAARFSQVFAHNGFPVVGSGPMGEYLFGPLSTQYWRLSLGLSYRFGSNLVIKGEYSFNRRDELGDGHPRENFVALEAAYQF